MQQASDCDMVLTHDNDLVAINGIGHGAVSGILDSECVVLMLAVTGNPRTGRDDGSSPEVQHRNT
jgi:hypothetical protein